MGIKNLIHDSIDLLKSAKKPEWDEVKRMVYITLLFFFIVAIISVGLFYAINILQFLLKYL